MAAHGWKLPIRLMWMLWLMMWKILEQVQAMLQPWPQLQFHQRYQNRFLCCEGANQGLFYFLV